MLNKIHTIGRLTADPSLKSVNDVSCLDFTIASDTKLKDGDGNIVVNFYKVTVWRGLAELCSKYLIKGSKVSVVGDFALRSYADKNGQTRTSPQITATDIEFLTPKSNNNVPASINPPVSSDDDELPFG